MPERPETRHARYQRGIGITCVCRHCRIEFTPKARDRTTYCSRQCAWDYRRAHPRPKPQPKHTPKTERFCLHCDVSVGMHWSDRYCSSACKWAAYKQRRPNILEVIKTRQRSNYVSSPERRRKAFMQAQRRRAKLRGQFVENIDRMEIFERDNWTCGICGQPVDKTLLHPHPHSASVDHKIPISRGGLHERSNVQTAHLRCNLSKHARVPQQRTA